MIFLCVSSVEALAAHPFADKVLRDGRLSLMLFAFRIYIPLSQSYLNSHSHSQVALSFYKIVAVIYKSLEWFEGNAMPIMQSWIYTDLEVNRVARGPTVPTQNPYGGDSISAVFWT